MAESAAWRHICTAPQDGTEILVPIGHGFSDVVSWRDGGWREGGNGMRLRKDPTHWMQIPSFVVTETKSTDQDSAEF